MSHSVFGASSTQTLSDVKDSVSKVAGNQNGFDYCGQRDFVIATIPSSYFSKVLAFDSSTKMIILGLPVTTKSDVKSYTIAIKIWLTNYPTVTTTATFYAHVTDCELTALTTTPVSS
jgi:hypothetical protein